MASSGPSYGLSRECQMKTRAKFDLERARTSLLWIEEILGEELDPPSSSVSDQIGVRDALRNGQALCNVMNILQPGAIKKVHTNKLAFKQMENIEQFLRACRQYGMKEMDVFQTQDLYESKAMYSVINCLYSLGSLVHTKPPYLEFDVILRCLGEWTGQVAKMAQKNEFDGPVLGVKIADKNIRHFTEEQLVEGKKIIGLQYGTNQVASQKGMTPYGSTRKM